MTQGPQDPNVEWDMSSVVISVVFQYLTQLKATQDEVVTSQSQAITTQANRGVGPQVNPNACMPACRI